MRLPVVAVVVVALGAAVYGVVERTGASASGSIPFCSGGQLAGRFAVVPGSAGAGNIVYRLTLRNRSGSACVVTGLPAVQLLGRTGRALPTHPLPARPGTATAVLVRLAPGATTAATARFSPDVPGVGEGSRAPCEPTSFRLRVTARGGGATVAPIVPATPVCEHGRLAFTNYSRA